MGYDNMLRLNYQIAGASRYTFIYDADGLKRYKDTPARTTVIWDGRNYLGCKS